MVVFLTNLTKKVYGMYSLLRKCAPDANMETLRQISVYVAGCTDDKFNINCDCECNKFNYNENNDYYLLSLNDGKKIVFSNNSLYFGFLVFNCDLDNHIIMSSYVSERIPGDLTTLSVYSEITSDEIGKYVVTFKPNDMSDNSLKFGTINYYTNDEIEWVHEISGRKEIERDFDIVAKENDIYPFAEKVFFDLPLEFKDTELDCYDGRLKNYLIRVDLLYNNIRVLMNNKGKKKERKL